MQQLVDSSILGLLVFCFYALAEMVPFFCLHHCHASIVLIWGVGVYLICVQRMRLTTVSTAMQNSSNHHNCTDLKVGSVGNLSSGMSTSDSESDDDHHVYRSKTFTTIWLTKE